MRKEIPPNQEPQITPKIDNLILIDRNVDMITPMMTQLTYEGLIDENFGIKYSNSILYILENQSNEYKLNFSSNGNTAR